MTDIMKSIQAIDPDAKVTVYEDNVDKIVWNDESKKISKEDILAKQKELQTAYDNNKYQRDRIEEYPSIGDQLDMIYHAGQGGGTFQKTIKAVKDKYPKG